MGNKPVVCVGAALIDESFSLLENPLQGTSNPATYYHSAGGVARNIAYHLALLGHAVELISHFGLDTDGQWLMEQCTLSGISISHSLKNNLPTGRFAALLSPTGELFIGAAASELESEITPSFLSEKISLLQSASVLLVECNLSCDSLDWIIEFSRKEKIPCIIEPVSVPKAKRLMNVNLQNILLVTPNQDELVALNSTQLEKSEEELIGELLQRGVQNVWIKNGKAGSRFYSAMSMYELSAPTVKVADTTGAGDAALAGWIHGWLLKKNSADCLRYGHAMASIILKVKGTVYKNLNADLLEKTIVNY